MFDRLLQVSADRYQALETVLLALLTERSIGTAVGSQLDGIGQIMGLARSEIQARVVQNLLIRTEEFGHPDWVKIRVTVDDNVKMAPDGTLTADEIIEDGTPALTHELYQPVSVPAGLICSLQIRLKRAAGSRNFRITITGTLGIINGIFNFNTFEATSFATGDGSIISVSMAEDERGYYLCTLTGTPSANSAVIEIYLTMLDDSLGSVYNGDSASGFYIWGAMLNIGPPDIYVRNGSSIIPKPVVDTSDASYRYALLSQFLSLTKSGSVEDVINAYKIVMGSTGAEYEEIYPAMFQLSATPLVDTTDPVVAAFITQTMQRIKPAGVNMILSTSGGFTLSQSSEADVNGNGPLSDTEGFGSSLYGETDGGELSRVI